MSFIKNHKQLLSVTFVVFLLALSLRLFHIGDEGINPDENLWHRRANEFHYHIVRDDWDKTMRSGHPGGTMMWQSMISLRTLRRIYRKADPTFDYQDFPHLVHTFDRVHFAHVLPIVLTTSLFVAFTFFALSLLTNRLFAGIATALILSDAYFLAHSRVVQMDGIQSSYIIGSVLMALLYHRYRKKYLIVLTGILLAFNAMTKIYGLAILPVLWLIINWEATVSFLKTQALQDLKRVIKPTLCLLVPFVIMSCILLPSWVLDLGGTLDRFERSIFKEGLQGKWEGHEIFFGRKYYRGEPRIFYLFAFLFRQSVVPFVALPLTLILLLKNKISDPKVRRFTIIIGLVALYWTAILMIPNKKEDRYIVGDHVMTDIFAAGGIYGLYKLMQAKNFMQTALQKWLLVIASVVILLSSFYLSVDGLRYEYLAYYNPLLGGSRSAVKYIRVAWGEGMRPIAEYLNEQEDPENIRVASWYENSLAPFCKCEVRPTYAYASSEVSYVVFYVNQIQREKETVMIEKYFHPDNIVFVNKVDGFPYSWLAKKDP